MPVEDDCFQGSIRVDGRGMFLAHLFEVKKPSESKGPVGPYNKISHGVGGRRAHRPLKDGAAGYFWSIPDPRVRYQPHRRC